MSRAGSVRRAAALGLLALFLCGSTLAQYRHRVVLVEQPELEPASAEVIARVRGELTAAGFEVVLLPGSPDGDPGKLSETTGRELHPAAAVLVLERPAEDGAPPTIELWLNDRFSRRTFVLRLPIDAEDASRGYQRVAVQAVELLKARLAELAFQRELESAAPEPEPPEPPPLRIPPPAPRSGVMARFGAGGGMVQGFDGVGAVLSPFVKLGASVPLGSIGGLPAAFDLGVRMLAFGTSTTVEASGGEARLEQALGTADAGLRLSSDGILQPSIAVGVGAYHVDVQGRALGDGLANASSTWSALTTLGVGILMAPSPALGIELEGHLGRAWSKTTVLVEDQRVADLGAPLALVSLAAVGTF